MTTTPWQRPDAAPTIGTEEEEDEFYINDLIPMTPEVQTPTAIAFVLLILTAITGNAITIYAYITDKRLHTVYHFYIFNLAVADLLLACVSMPIQAVYVIMDFNWLLGIPMCKAFLATDFTLCFQTILIMLVLSVDRLLMITMGLKYIRVITKKVAMIQMVISWCVSFLLYGPAILFWDLWTGKSTVAPGECDVEFAYDTLFTTTTAMIEFALPFVCLIFLNVLSYIKIRSKIRVAHVHPDRSLASQTCAISMVTTIGKNTHHPGEITAVEPADASNTASSSHLNRLPPPQTASTTHRDKKALRSLATLVLAFLIFWAPYTISTMVISFCERRCIEINLYEAFVWLLWAKSAINPFLYAFNSSVYRIYFRKLFLVCIRHR